MKNLWSAFKSSGAAETVASINDLFTDIDLEFVTSKILGFFNTEARCENVVWIMASQFRELTLNSSRTVNQSTIVDIINGNLLQSIRPIAEAEVAGRLKNLSGYGPTIQAVNVGPGRQDVLLTITDINKVKAVAFVLLIGVRSQKVKVVRRHLEEKLNAFSKYLSFAMKYDEARRQNYKDDLTGLYNQKFLTMALENEVYRAQRDNGKFSVLFMDIDYFKSINDSSGHLVGSRVLLEIGQIMKKSLRKSDYAFRYGGDEYVVILPKANVEGAKIAAERIRKLVEATHFKIDNQLIQLTLSIGISTYPDHAKTHKDIIKMADEAMYCGKHKSRNVVFVAS